jgi:hypothetical protein
MSYLLDINFEKKSIKMLTNSADLLKTTNSIQMSFLRPFFSQILSYGFQQLTETPFTWLSAAFRNSLEMALAEF